MIDKIKVSYHYKLFHHSCGCCSDNTSWIEFSNRPYDDWEIGRTVFDIEELEEIMEDNYGKDWKDTYEIDVDVCDFY